MKHRIINIAVLVLVCFGIAAWGLTTTTGQHILNSLIDSTPIGQTTPAAGSFTNLNAGVARVAGISIPAPAPSNSSMIGWNATNGGGEMDFLNDSGLGTGGFNWYWTSASANNSWSASSPLMTLGSNGVLSTSAGFTTAGGVVGSSASFGQVISTLHGNVFGNVTGNVNGNVTGNVSGSAGSLANDPPNCQSDQAAIGINQSGAATCGPHIQATSTTSCTTGASSYSSCQVTGTFPQAFTGGYYITCQLVNASDPRARVGNLVSWGPQTFAVDLVTDGSVSVSAYMNCTGIQNN